MNLYNENDDYCCDWLENLIRAKLIPDGVVDRRDIRDIKPRELAGYKQCHFFAGLGGWPLALARAGVGADEPLWTGSCPCQPFSAAGKQRGFADERHLWPFFHYLIEQCRPPVVLGEQVASADGREWFAGVRADLEDMGYACGCADLCAAGFGAPHIRQRLYWVADANQARWGHPAPGSARTECDWLGADGVGCGFSFWDRDGEPRRFADGSTRRTKSDLGILVDGFPGRVATVGAFGNAIVPQVAAEFIRAALNLP